MRRGAVAAYAWAFVSSASVTAQPAVSLRSDGSLQISGRAVSCGSVRNVLDSTLPTLGLSAPTRKLLVLNPVELGKQPTILRLFVFHHECGHHHVGASELAADCWSIREGVRAGWMNKAGLAQVCNLMGGLPQTPTHPSGAERCKNMTRCFASIVGK